MFKFAFLLRDSNSPCFDPIKTFFLTRSNFVRKMGVLASEKYGINNILDNDPEAVFARIAYVYLREPRYTGYHPTMNNNDT